MDSLREEQPHANIHVPLCIDNIWPNRHNGRGGVPGSQHDLQRTYARIYISRKTDCRVSKHKRLSKTGRPRITLYDIVAIYIYIIFMIQQEHVYHYESQSSNMNARIPNVAAAFPVPPARASTPLRMKRTTASSSDDMVSNLTS